MVQNQRKASVCEGEEGGRKDKDSEGKEEEIVMTSNLLLNKLMKRITKSSSDSKDTDKSGEDAVSLRNPSKKFLQYVSSSKHVSRTKSKSHRKKTTPREKSTTTVTPSTAEQKPVGALENKEELESKLMSVASQGGIAGEMASSALEEGVEKEREQYGELATQEYQAKRTQSALRRSLSSLASSFSKNVRASREIEKDITEFQRRSLINSYFKDCINPFRGKTVKRVNKTKVFTGRSVFIISNFT